MAWNQQAAWSVQATPAYAVPGGYAATLAAANAAAAAPAAAGVAAGAYAAVQGYGQWPAYGGAAPAAAAAAVPAAAIASWPQAAAAGPSVQQQQQQQQWEQWTQWQQQYAQWQQQYGKDYMAAMQASGQTAVLPGMPIATIGSGAPLTPALPSGAPPTTPAAPPLPASPPPPQPGAPKRPLEGKNGGNASKKSKTEIDEGIQTIKNSLAEMAEAEKQFDEQFNSWENQFNSWKKENANHPDTDQYQAYEAKWTSWRNQLLQRREQMKKKKDAKMAELEKLQEEKKALEMPPMSAPVVPAALDTYGQSYGNLSAAQGFPGSQVYQVGPNSPLFPETAAKASAVPSAENALTAVNQTTFTTSINTYTSQAGGSIPSVSASGVSAIPVLGETAPSSGGIPGLDLIDSSGAKPSPYIVPTSISVSVGSTNKPIETPTDSEPFNFPQPKNAGWPQMPPMSGPPPGMGGPPMGMPPMSGPPPGFMGMPPPMGNHMGPPLQFNQNQPPPMGKDSPNSGRPNHFQPGQGPDLNQPPPFNDGTGRGGWAPNDDESRNFGKFPNNQGPGRNSGPPFSTDKRPPWAPAGKAGLLPTPVMSNSFGNKPGPKDDVNDEIDDPYADERWEQMAEEDRASETSENQRGGPGPGMRGPPPRNSYGGQFNDQMRPGGPFNNQMRGQFDGPPPGQFGGPGPMRGGFNRPSLLSMPGGPPNQQRPQFNQQGPYSNQQGPYPHQQGPPPNQQGPHPNQQGPHPNQQGPLHNQQGPHPNQQGPHPNQQGPHPNQRGPPNQSGGPLPLMSLPLEHLAPKGQPLGPPDETLPKLLPGDKPTSDQCPPGQAPTEILENKQPAQPVFEAEVIIDYRHRPAEIGFPDMFEADSMADYAHGANDMTEIMNADIHQDQSRPYDRVQPGWHAPGLNRGNPPPRGRDDFMDRDRRDFPRDWPPRGFESPRDRFDDRRVRDLDRHRRSPPRRSVEEERRSREAGREHHEKRSRDDRRPPSQPAVENRPPSRPADQSEPAAPAGAANSVQQVKTFPIADLLLPPGRNSRPPRILIVLRGLPGSGKSYVAKLIKEKEVEMGGTAPRILSIDDYFMVETEKEEVDPETNRKVTKKVMEYEHEAGMETSYQNSLIKAFRKTVSDGYFPFIIVDSPHSKTSNYEDIVGFGKQKGFQVYICEMESDLNECFKRNIHGRTLDDIEKMGKIWEKTPPNEVILDIRSLLQEAAITEVDMEDTVEETTSDEAAQKAEEGNEAPKADENESSAPKSNGGSEIEATAADDPKKAEEAKEEDDDVEEVSVSGFFTAANRSKWDDLDSSTNKLDRLDGLAKARTSTTIKDWLQLPEDYFEARSSAAAVSGGKKRVRWADLEERYEQEKMRAIGFVVGQTDWNRMLDPTGGQSALTQTKYI